MRASGRYKNQKDVTRERAKPALFLSNSSPNDIL
nr:MAG TPA: hypothetical protein [Caudoviricetes sp.]